MTPEPERLPFFVYGTLCPGGTNHAWALRGRTAREEPARITGALLYDGPGYPYAVAGPPEAVVHGALVLPREADYDEVRATLDRLEGYAPGDPANLYERVTTEAVRTDGSTEPAWVYLAAEPLAGRLRSTGTPVEGGAWRGAAAAGGHAPANLDDSSRTDGPSCPEGPSRTAEQV
ncbi:gamma-glutamylcyclotransferase family protein [Streptomyces lydicus]|uniref:gamma-glutamylcyclotransferase family protein n=1 Tax=Streptomyces lydicus TaxID=47763 RepID=UPI0037B1568A